MGFLGGLLDLLTDLVYNIVQSKGLYYVGWGL
jgi:hypothetical protein